MGRAARTAAALVVATAALAGCSEAEPASETLPSTSAQAAPTTEALPPLGPADFPMPPEARQKTPAGAVEFTRYYMALGNHIATGPLDPEPLLELSNGCNTCQMVVDSYAADRTAGYMYGPSTYTFAESGPAMIEGDTAAVGFIYAESALTVYRPNGEVVQERSAAATGTLQSGAQLTWDAERVTWLVQILTVG
ncbi:hypothetical protein JD79_00927 [Geodermatophilus normandii]|uniref:DUF6318 domain-containing protein n=2 Tax=Geodermatophilus normandii TaxID=1137989 RepID=A0A317QGN4_9ACTN|nr:hypothetical protein JD79_00927 [Geodermatophilus normandii]